MDIINLVKVGPAYTLQSWPEHLPIPEGRAVVADELDRAVYRDYNGIVTLTVEEQVRVVGTHEEPREVVRDLTETPLTGEDGELIYSITETVYETVEDTAVVHVVTAWEPDLEEWEAWKAEQPDPVEPAVKETVSWEAMAAAIAEGVNEV